jgi:hypothetical protein
MERGHPACHRGHPLQGTANGATVGEIQIPISTTGAEGADTERRSTGGIPPIVGSARVGSLDGEPTEWPDRSGVVEDHGRIASERHCDTSQSG